jgi:hypothetical protein
MASLAGEGESIFHHLEEVQALEDAPFAKELTLGIPAKSSQAAHEIPGIFAKTNR